MVIAAVNTQGRQQGSGGRGTILVTRRGSYLGPQRKRLVWEPFVTRMWDVEVRPRFHLHKGRRLGLLYTERDSRTLRCTAWGTDSLSDRVSTAMSQL